MFAGIPGSSVVWPLNVLAAAFALTLIAAAARMWLPRRLTARPTPTMSRPDGLAPALAGALALGRADPRLALATILGLSQRGALTCDPAGRDPRVRLIDRGLVADRHEARLWDELAARADTSGLVNSRGIAWALNTWEPVAAALRQDLADRGWFHSDPDRARRPYRIGAGIALGLAAFCLVLRVVLGDGAALIGAALFALSATGFVVLGNRLPETTAAGEAAAGPWRAYRAGLMALGRDDPDALRRDDLLADAFALLDDATLRRIGAPAVPVDLRPALVRPAAGWELAPIWIAFAYESQVASSAHHGGGIGAGLAGHDGGLGGAGIGGDGGGGW